MMSLKVNIGQEEFLDFQRVYYRSDKEVKKSVNRSKFVGPVVFFLIFLFQLFQYGTYFIWIPLLFFSIVSILWSWLIPKYMQWTFLRKARRISLDPANIHMFGEREIILTDDTIMVNTTNEQNTFKLQNLVAVKESADNIFLFGSTLQALVIPKKQISREEVDKIREILQKHIK